MYVVPPSPSAVSLFGRNGRVRSFPSKSAALRELGYAWIRDNVGQNFRTAVSGCWTTGLVHQSHDFVLRDDQGQALTAADFWPEVVSRGPLLLWRYHFWDGHGPVPFTAKRRGGYRYFRRVGTFPERRQASWFAEEDEPPPRASRNASNLPTNYDDISRGMTRSWKKHRKTQWKDTR